jgi:thiol-disulfide isomerase/thioredoxin
VRARHLWGRSATRAGLTILVPLAALVLVVVTTIPGLATRIATREMSAAAPIFSISRLDGTVVNSAEFHGRVVVLDYWATWCPACRREMPELERLYQRYKGDSRVSFWAVDVQMGGETPEKARAFMQNAGYTLPIALCSEKSGEELEPEGFPSLVIIDTAGRVRLIHTGYDRSEQLQAKLSGEIDTLLTERP